jgi:hypothetical protein
VRKHTCLFKRNNTGQKRVQFFFSQAAEKSKGGIPRRASIAGYKELIRDGNVFVVP